MDAIISYIDNMFRSLPRSEEVTRAQRELQQMCEDRYHELRDEGASENEAVGRVITQFGNLDDLADELGIRRELDGAVVGDTVEVTRKDAERFLQIRRNGSRLIALGIFTILLGVSQMIWFNIGSDDGEFEVISLVLFFVAVAAAVAMFITGGMSMSRYERYEKKELRLDPNTLQYYRDLRESEHGRYTASIVIGVLIIILGFGIGAISGVVGGEENVSPLVSFMPAVIAVGVGVLVIGGMRRGSLDMLTSHGDYDPEKRKENELIGKIAGPYWMLALVIFLAWSFIGDAWDHSWMVWPIAGVLFGLIAVTAESFFGDRDKDKSQLR